MKEFGVLYFVDDNPHFGAMLELSVASLRRHHPDWPVEVARCRPLSTPVWKKVYRALSPWKWRERADRGHQDWRVLHDKAQAMLDSPFAHTLFLDADTIVMRPLDALRRRAEACDVMATALPWKQYPRLWDWQPEQIPMVMAGVVWYTRAFTTVYGALVAKMAEGVRREGHCDQYMFSTLCAQAPAGLRIAYAPELQLDVMNAAQHLGRQDYPRCGNALDLRAPVLNRFHVFHYNGPHKREYLKQIREVWGLDVDDASLKNGSWGHSPSQAGIRHEREGERPREPQLQPSPSETKHE